LKGALPWVGRGL